MNSERNVPLVSYNFLNTPLLHYNIQILVGSHSDLKDEYERNPLVERSVRCRAGQKRDNLMQDTNTHSKNFSFNDVCSQWNLASHGAENTY